MAKTDKFIQAQLSPEVVKKLKFMKLEKDMDTYDDVLRDMLDLPKAKTTARRKAKTK